jgi:hypothetical protein
MGMVYGTIFLSDLEPVAIFDLLVNKIKESAVDI